MPLKDILTRSRGRKTYSLIKALTHSIRLRVANNAECNLIIFLSRLYHVHTKHCYAFNGTNKIKTILIIWLIVICALASKYKNLFRIIKINGLLLLHVSIISIVKWKSPYFYIGYHSVRKPIINTANSNHLTYVLMVCTQSIWIINKCTHV